MMGGFRYQCYNIEWGEGDDSVCSDMLIILLPPNVYDLLLFSFVFLV